MDAEPTTVDAYNITREQAERIISEARARDMNKSQLVRLILRDYFKRLDIERQMAEKSA